ncbi:hypothetical protein [Synechococcus sp. R6-6]
MQVQLHSRLRPLSLTLMAVGGSWLLGSCQLRGPQVQLPGDVLPETALVPQSAPLVLTFSTQPEESFRTHPDLLAQWES